MKKIFLQKLEKKIGYRFADRDLLRLALTHSSYSNEKTSGDARHITCNERLEFLGDSVLQLISVLFGNIAYFKLDQHPAGALVVRISRRLDVRFGLFPTVRRAR